jgi:hypothetical protein
LLFFSRNFKEHYYIIKIHTFLRSKLTGKEKYDADFMVFVLSQIFNLSL